MSTKPGDGRSASCSAAKSASAKSAMSAASAQKSAHSHHKSAHAHSCKSATGSSGTKSKSKSKSHSQSQSHSHKSKCRTICTSRKSQSSKAANVAGVATTGNGNGAAATDAGCSEQPQTCVPVSTNGEECQGTVRAGSVAPASLSSKAVGGSCKSRKSKSDNKSTKSSSKSCIDSHASGCVVREDASGAGGDVGAAAAECIAAGKSYKSGSHKSEGHSKPSKCGSSRGSKSAAAAAAADRSEACGGAKSSRWSGCREMEHDAPESVAV